MAEGRVGIELRPVWNTSFQLDLKLIQRKKVGGPSTFLGYIDRVLNNSRRHHSCHSL